MNRRHATVISTFLAIAIALGAAAVLRTSGDSAAAASAGELVAQNAQLDRYETQLQNAANARPPTLPAATPAAAMGPQPVVYVRSRQAAEPDHHDDDHDRHDSADGHDHHDGHDGHDGHDDD